MNTTRTNPTRTRRSAPRGRQRRGVAMLLVLVALGAATVMGSAYVASREAAPVIAANAEVSSNAKWAAQSGANLAVAILQTSLPIDADLDEGAIVSGVSFNLAESDAFVTNASGQPITGADRFVLVNALGDAGRIGSIQQRRVVRRPTNHVTQALDPHLRDFAVYAVDRARFESGAFVAPWPDSVRGPALYTADIAVGFSGSARLSSAGSQPMPGARLVLNDAATESLRTAAASTHFAGVIETEARFPRASVRVPAELDAIPAGLLGVSSLSSLLPATVLSASNASVSASGGGVVTFNAANGRDYSVFNLTANNGTIRIVGDVRILVRNDLDLLDRSAIDLAPGARLEIYVRDDVTISNSVVGFPKTTGNNTFRHYSNLTGVFDSSRARIFVVDPSAGGEADQLVALSGRALLAAEIHAPAAAVDITGDSAIIGRVTAYDFRLRNNSIIFYDHALNRGGGLADTTGPLYDPVRGPVLRKALATFDDASGVDSLMAHVRAVFNDEGVDPDPADDAPPLSAVAPDPRDAFRNVVVAPVPGVVRALEAGLALESTYFGAAVLASDNGTLLRTKVSGRSAEHRASNSTTRSKSKDDDGTLLAAENN